MLQTILGNIFVGGLVLFSVLALVVPIFVEVQKKVHNFNFTHLKSYIYTFAGIGLVLLLLLTLAK